MGTKQQPQGKQIAVLTGGGDAPGLNAVIRGITIQAKKLGYDVLGFRKGWAGLLDDGEKHPLDLDMVEDIHMLGGTILGTSRTNPFKVPDGVEQVKRSLKQHDCDYLIAIGGEDTLGVANKLSELGIKVVGVPKTIDNDLSVTDYSFGFDTAINNAMHAIDSLHTTAKSHHRIMVVEIMGRHSGWLALHSGIAGGAHFTILPEEKFSSERIAKLINKREAEGKTYTMIAISEGAVPEHEKGFATQTNSLDAFGHVRLGGIAEHLAEELEKRTGKEARHVVLGHLQRAGHPSAFDRVLGTRLGIHAAQLVHKHQFGMMVSLQGTEIVAVPLENAVGTLKTVPKHRIDELNILQGEES